MLVKVEIEKDDLIEICHILNSWGSSLDPKTETFETGYISGRVRSFAERCLRRLKKGEPL